MVLLLDLMKGALPVVIAWLLLKGRYQANVGTLDWFMLKSAGALAALAAMAGHIWPIFLKFKGGRGVTTFYGGMFALCPPVAFLSGQVFILGASTTRFVSLASIAGAIVTYLVLIPLTIFSGFPWENLLYGMVGSIVIVLTHRDNIARLISGKERKLGEQPQTETPAAATTGAKLNRMNAPVRVGLTELKWSRQNLHR